MTEKTPQTPNRLLWLVAALYVLWALLYIWRASAVAIDGERYFLLFDDALISMRYARNLTQGEGLVWNEGERVEGYTNLLMVLFMAGPNALFDPRLAVLVVQLAGIGFVLISAWLAARLAGYMSEDVSVRPWLRLFTFASVLLYYPLSFWSLQGMETGPLTLLLMASVLFALRYVKVGRGGAMMALLLGLAYLTHPESLLIMILLLAYCWIARRPRRPLFRLILLAALLPLLQHAFRFAYYEALVPNTYTLKVSGMPLDHRLQNGLAYIVPFLDEHFLLLAIALAGLLINFSGRKLLLLLIVAAMIAYPVVVGGDAWPLWRLSTPVMPLLFLLVALDLLTLARALPTDAWLEKVATHSLIPARYAGVLLAGLVLALALKEANFRFWREQLLVDRPFLARQAHANINQAVALNAITTEDADVGVIWAGAIPYYTDRPAIDFLGKSDKRIAALEPDLSGAAGDHGLRSLPGHNKYDLDYSIVQRQPVFVQDFAWGGQEVSTWAEGHYILVEYQGIGLYLRRQGVRSVRWDLLTLPGSD